MPGWTPILGKNFADLLPGIPGMMPNKTPGLTCRTPICAGMPWAYVTTKEVSDTLIKCMAARNDKEAAELGRKLSKVIRDSRINIHLWSNHANFGANQKIVQWDQQLGSFPGTRFEYMKVKD